MQIIKNSSENINPTDKKLLLMFKSKNHIMTILVVLLFIVFFTSFTLGRYAIPLDELANVFLSKICTFFTYSQINYFFFIIIVKFY